MLFRKEALKAKQTRLYGQVLIAAPIKFWVITLFLSACILALILFLATASFARIETVRGAVVPTDGIVKVRAPSPGILTDFDLKEGARVTQDQVIGRITVSAAATDSGTRVGAQFAGIASKMSQLDARLEQSAALVQFEIAAKDRERVDLTNRITRSQDMLQFEMALLEEMERGSERIEQLYDRNLIRADAAFEQAMQLIRARQDVQRIQAEIEALTRQRDNISLEQDILVANARLKSLQLIAEREVLRDEREIIAGTQAYDIVAPTSGTATAVLVSDGYALDGARQIFSILPEGGTYQVELYLPSRVIGFVAPGQSVRLLFDAFPYQRFGAQSGTVAEVTSSVIMPGDQSLLVDTQEPVYRITVALEGATFAAYNRDVALQADMLLSANIILEDRTILSWLLDPLLSVGRRT